MPMATQQIPAGWKKVGLTDVARIRKGLTYRSVDYGDENNGLVFVTLKCIAKGGGFNKEGIKFYKGKYDQSNIVKSGDLIIANTDLTRAGDIIGAPLFMPNLSDTSVLISMDLSAIDIDQNQISKQYLYYCLLQDSSRQFMRSISSGSTVLHLQIKSLSSLDIFLPPLSEQTKIATILSKVDEEIEKVERIIEQTEKLKKGLMQKLLTKGIGHTKFKQSELGEIPEEWEILKGENISTLITKGASPKWQGFDYQDEGALFVTSENVRDGYLDISAPKFLPLEFNEKLKNSQLKKNDILINIVGASIGRSCIFNVHFQNANINQAVCLFRVKNNIDPNFAIQYLQIPSTIDRLLGQQSGSARQNLSLTNIRNFLFVVPPLDEQNEIAKILAKIDYKNDSNHELLIRLKKLKKGLMNDLLSGNVRVS